MNKRTETELRERFAQRIETQNNRATADPYYIVFKKEKIWGVNSEYCNDGYEWVDVEDSECSYSDDDDMYKTLELIADSEFLDEVSINGTKYEKVYFRVNEFKFVNAFLTEQSALDFCENQRHNHSTAYVYGWSGHDNPEIKELREYFKGDKS